MLPSTSYWPPTRSPRCSRGRKLNGVPQAAHSPSGLPGWPSVPRPTSAPQLLQYRLLSATTGSSSTADAGSLTGTTGTSTSPAPRRPRPVVRDWVRRPVPGNVPGPVPGPVLGPVCGPVAGPAWVGGGSATAGGGGGLGGSMLCVGGV